MTSETNLNDNWNILFGIRGCCKASEASIIKAARLCVIVISDMYVVCIERQNFLTKSLCGIRLGFDLKKFFNCQDREVAFDQNGAQTLVGW